MYELSAFRDKIRAEKDTATYDELAEKYPVNRWHLWMLVTQDDYRPTNEICDKLDIVRDVPVTPVNGRPIPAGAQVLMAQFCECGRAFIPNTPKRKKCFICSKYRGKK